MVKENAKGAKDIVIGNAATLNFYRKMITVTVILYAVVRWSFGFTWTQIILSLISGVSLSMLYGSMNSAAKGGTDLNMDGGVTDYFKDIIIVTCVVMILSLISDYFWYGWLIIPGFALVKLWTSVISPWIFAPAPEAPEGDMQQDGFKKGQRQTKQKKQSNYNSNSNHGMFSSYR
ncbi:transmembrane protein 208-like [Bolinopsis microptera]|uniref:transmembrane protein 208-like n=1 Tax=Bolinopsis microptera TaxID=2820187 RepID=UPI00307A105E